MNQGNVDGKLSVLLQKLFRTIQRINQPESRALYLAQPPETRQQIDRSLHQQLETTSQPGNAAEIELTAVVITANT